MIEVKVVKVPGIVKNIALEAGSTVRDALRLAEIEPDSSQALNVSGRPATQDTQLEDGDKLVVAKGAAGA